VLDAQETKYNMATFKQTFKVSAPLSAVWQLHDDPKALKELTPPPARVEILSMDSPLKVGANLIFRLKLIGPIGATWHAVYDEFNPYEAGKTVCNFVDRSVSSPFHFWVHRHTFRDLGDGTSTVTDEAKFYLFGGMLGEIVTWLLAWPAIAFMFLYRRQKTVQMLREMMRTQTATANALR
jgi:ligand-binding SRPBCC domain-containing protein